MIVKLEYTNLNGDKKIHNVECSDSDTLINGQPRPTDSKSLAVFEVLEELDNYRVIT